MRFLPTRLAGAYLIEPELHEDERGFFARTYCQREFAAHNLAHELVQCSCSYNARAGTLRGMHYQLPPFAEVKLIRCTAGAIFDVLVDIRPGSANYGQWVGETLTADNRKLLYIPEGCAHGFISLVDNTEVSYQMNNFYKPDLARGFRWNDPYFAIQWPSEPVVIAPRDRSYPDFTPAAAVPDMLARAHASL
jgi:dTDP-4-dehydrorhamnose 3,5-epimerase